MANYPGMTYGQTCFIRHLRRAGKLPGEGSAPMSQSGHDKYRQPLPETLRRWLEQPTFREMYQKVIGAIRQEMETKLLRAGVTATTQLVEAMDCVDSMDDAQRRLRVEIIRLSRASVGLVQASLDTEKEEESRFIDGCDHCGELHHPTIDCGEARLLIERMEESQRRYEASQAKNADAAGRAPQGLGASSGRVSV